MKRVTNENLLYSTGAGGGAESVCSIYIKLTLKCILIYIAAKSLQSCPPLLDPIEGSPPGSPVPGILQARTLEWVAISFSNAWKWKVKVKLLSCVPLLVTSWTAAYQAHCANLISSPYPLGLPRWHSGERICLPMQEMQYILGTDKLNGSKLNGSMKTYKTF